jgi:putative transposase
MPNHVHLLIHPLQKDYDVAPIKQHVKQSVSQRAISYLRKHDSAFLEKLRLRDGSYRFWQAGGGYDRNLFTPEALRSAIDYIHNNPLRKGLIDDPRGWKWSSAAFYHLGEEGPLRLDQIDWLV